MRIHVNIHVHVHIHKWDQSHLSALEAEASEAMRLQRAAECHSQSASQIRSTRVRA